MYRKGAFAIIVGPDGLLLIIQKPSFLDTEWTFVGGGREAGETSL